MSHLEGLYLTQLRQRERDELDAWMAERLQQPRQAAPGAATPTMGIGEEFTRGVVRGGANVAGSLGTLLKAGGALTGSNMLSQAGESMATYWSQVVQRHAPSEEAQQSLWDNPTAVLNPRWLTASVAESIPSLAAAMVPAAGAGAALSIGGRLIGWTPAVALKLARIGAAVTGGVIGGGLEGAQTFEEVKRRGGSDEEALKALAFMGLASAGLNALSLGQAFKTPARAGLLPLAKRVGMAGVSEGLTEWLEEPTEAVILGEDWNGILEAGKRGLNVIPAAALTGGAANVAVGAAKGAGAAAPVLATERGSMTLEEGGSAAGEPQATEAAKMPQLGETLTVNLKYIDGDRELKAMTAAINRLNAERMAGDRATKSVDTMRQRGRELLPTLDAALEWNPVEAPFKDVEGGLRALADWRDTATQHFDSIHAAALKGDPEARARYHQAWTLAYGLAAKVELGESIAGRTLRMQQELSSPNEGSREELMALADTMRDASDTNLDAFIARVDVLKKRQRNVMGRQSINFLRAGQNALYEAWINALLSGPQTLVAVNPISNALTTLWAIPERAIAAQLHTGTDVGVVKGEASIMLHAIVESFFEGLQIARMAWRDFESGGDAQGFLNATKLDIPRHAITAGAFGQDPNGSVGRALDLLGAGVRFPSRFMAATDAFFKAVNYRGELHALALREATAEGLEGNAFTRRVAQIVANPPAEVKERAEQFMLLQTFQNDLGDAGKALMKLRDASGIGRLIIPFLKTPTNIAKWVVFRTIATPVVLGKFGAERTLNLVGLNSLANSFRSELSEPGPIRDLALARMSLGALLGASVAALAGASLITGGGPSDPDLKRQLRETGWQPYSFKIGDTYYSYNRLDPIGAVVGLVADTSEIVGQLPEVQADSLVAAVVLSLSKTMINKTYMQGLADAIEAISNPERGATKYAQSFARTLIPTAVRTLERTVDPTLREARTVLESMQASVPGWSASLPARRNLFGEPIMLQGGLGWDLVSPIYTSTIKDDAGAAELARHRVDISMPSRVLEGRSPALMRLESRGISGVELSGQEYSDYIRLAGEGLRDELNRLVASPSYAAQSDGPDGGKALLLRQIIYAYRQVGRARLLFDNTDIQRRHVEYLERRATALLAGSLGR